MAVADEVGRHVQHDLGGAGETGEVAAVVPAETAGAVPSGGGLKVVAGEQDVAAIDLRVEGTVPPGLSGERSDVETVVAPAKVTFLWQQSIRADCLGGEPWDVVFAAVGNRFGDPWM